MAITDELLSVELFDASGHLNGKLKGLQQNVALHLSNLENLLFQLEALSKQLEQRNKGFEYLKTQWNLLREYVKGHKKSIEWSSASKWGVVAADQLPTR